MWANGDGKLSGAASRQDTAWRWKERALAYDQPNREEKAALEAVRAAEARDRRLRRMEKIIDDTAAALDTADLKNLSQQKARGLLPSLRLLSASTVELQRRELQSPLAPDQADPLGAGDLRLPRRVQRLQLASGHPQRGKETDADSHHRPYGQPLRRHRLPGRHDGLGSGLDPPTDRLPDIPVELRARDCFDWAEGIVPLQESGHSGQFK